MSEIDPQPVSPQPHNAGEQQTCVSPWRRAYWDLSLRARGHELMDDPAVDSRLLAAALRGLRYANRWASGREPLLRALGGPIAPQPKTLTLLDVGTGSADLPLAVVRWARGRRVQVRVVAVDNHATTLQHAQTYMAQHATADEVARVQLIRADAFRLPVCDASVDDVHASLFLHHFADAEVVALLREFARVARGRVMVNDLIRSHLNLAVLTAATCCAPRVFRHDGRLSVRRGFRPAELQRLAQDAGLADVVIRRHRWWRFSLIARVPPRPDGEHIVHAG